MKWRMSYTSYDNKVLDELYKPALRQSKSYKRISGYFSASFLENLSLEIEDSININNLYIQILCSPIMSDNDKESIRLGYDMREKISEFIAIELKKISEESEALPLISNLIARKAVDIKFVVTERTGMFHDKKGIFKDNEGNRLAFTGSNNETNNAMFNNYESLVVLNDWENKKYVDEIENDFDKIWNGEKVDLILLEVTKELNEQIERISKTNTLSSEDIFSTVNIYKKYSSLYEYQLKAVKSWRENDYKGLLEMATGTGKTITALACYQELAKEIKKMVTVIVVPQIELLYQWEEDIINSDSRAIICSGDNPSWPGTLKNRIRRLSTMSHGYINIIVTRDTFISNKFIEIINVSEIERLIISDEVHSFGSETTRKKFEQLEDIFNYRLGISATPFRKNESESKELINFFGGIVFSYSLNEAIKSGFLNNYEYYIKLLYFDKESLEQYRNVYYTNKEKLMKKNIEAMNQIEKITATIANSSTSKIDELVSSFSSRDDEYQSIVYCSPGGYNNNINKFEEKHIDIVAKKLSEIERVKLRKIRSQVNSDERKKILTQFKERKLNVLVAIKCLDQGINLPEVTDAYILSSTDSQTEFIQRRGRILRTYPGKPTSKIYDYVMLPQDYSADTFEPDEADAYFVARELKRMRAYQDGADNFNEIQKKINIIEDAYRDLLEANEYGFNN